MPKYLYRFISFEDFINLVINNKDRFMRPSAWDDGYEAYLFSHLDSPEDVRDIVTQMVNEIDLDDYSVVYDYYFRLWHSKNFSYAQSWSEYDETDAMWRCYSHHKKQSAFVQPKKSYSNMQSKSFLPNNTLMFY